jgi:hypothetical protein
MIQYSSINDAWGNKEIYKKTNNIDNFINNKVESFTQPQVVNKVETFTQPQVVNTPEIVNNHSEHFNNPAQTNYCSFSEHLKNCEHCKNSLTEYFTNDGTISNINLFGLNINITKDVLKIIFIILIILIFIILLSMINISLKDFKSQMKYYMVPNMPYYH